MAFEANAPADAVSDENSPDLLTQFDALIKGATRRASYYLTGTSNAADDLAQDVRCHLVASIRRNPVTDAAFVRKTITNSIRSRIRSERRRIQLGSFATCELDEKFGELQVRASENAVVLSISQWLATLPERLRATFYAVYLHGYTQREAGRVLKISQPRMSQLHRELLDRGRRDLLPLAV